MSPHWQIRRDLLINKHLLKCCFKNRLVFILHLKNNKKNEIYFLPGDINIIDRQTDITIHLQFLHSASFRSINWLTCRFKFSSILLFQRSIVLVNICVKKWTCLYEFDEERMRVTVLFRNAPA